MGLLDCSNTYRSFMGQCTQCGHCTKACSSLVAADMTLGQIAQAMLAAERASTTREELAANIAANPSLVQAVRGCFFCTSCKNTCFAHNDVCDLIYHARVDFQNLGLIERDAWSSVLVDQEWDIFTAYRAIHGIGYADLTRHLDDGAGAAGEAEATGAADEASPANVSDDDADAAATSGDFDVAFFPGCSLAAYGPELTREIFATVEELGGKTTMIDHCCGSSLKSAGFFDRAEALCDRNSQEIASSGAKQLVCVCPGCANDMGKSLARSGLDVEVVSLAAFLNEHGFTPKRALPETPLCLSKSCQDRDGTYLQDTCAVLGVDPDIPSIFHGCCGAGGAVSAFDPNRQAAQADSKLSFAQDGATVITMCPTCTYTYAFRLMNEPRNVVNKHYTELLFESGFDWPLVFAQLGGMWSGEYGAWLAEVFA